MKARVYALALLGAVLAFGSHYGATAQTTAVPQAELFMVKKGVFTLKQGQSIDLTDRSILLHLREVAGNAGEPVRGISITISGYGGGQYSVGHRWDLKQWQSTRDILKDLRSCFLDVVSAAKPQGAPPTATFRLLCD